MSRSALDRIRDIRDAISAIRVYESGDRDSDMVFDAVRMRLIEIGEAVSGLPVDLLASEPTIPWREIVGMRNWMAHRYFDTVDAYVWSAVDHDLPPLSDALERVALSLQGEESD